MIGAHRGPWLPLRAFRPGADPLLNFAEALARTLTNGIETLEAEFARVEAAAAVHRADFERELSDSHRSASRTWTKAALRKIPMTTMLLAAVSTQTGISYPPP